MISKENFESLFLRFNVILGQYLNSPVGIKDIPRSIIHTSLVSSWLMKEIKKLADDVGDEYGIIINSGTAHEMLSNIYLVLFDNVKETQKVQAILEFYGGPPSGVAGKYFNKVLKAVKNEFLNKNITIIPVCSISDGTYRHEWSDIDCMLVIPEQLMGPSGLYQLQPIIRKFVASFSLIDPLQGHGVFVITPLHLKYFSESFMPMVVLETGYVWPQKNRSISIDIISRNDCTTNISFKLFSRSCFKRI